MRPCVRNTFVNTQVRFAASQQLLTVELLQFHNMYNAEIVKGKFCCCDSNANNCRQQLEQLAIVNCKAKCDVWFNVSLSPCLSPHSCSAATAAQCKSPSVQTLSYKFEFVMCNSPETVSLNKSSMTTLIYCCGHVCMCACMQVLKALKPPY